MRCQQLKPILAAVVFLAAVVVMLMSGHQRRANFPLPSENSPKIEEQNHRSLNFLRRFTNQLFSPYVPNQYPLQKTDSFVQYRVCTDIRNEGCENSNTIRFVSTQNPAPNEFRYQDKGPPQMQAQEALDSTLDIFDLIASSSLVSFAETRHGGGVNTGVIQTDANGYEYVTRPVGDHSWSTTTQAPDTYLSFTDVLYLWDMVEGTLDNPIKFDIIFNFKAWFECLRFNFGRTFSALGRFEQELITDPNSPHRLRYPGSVVWIRRSTYLSLIPREYLVIQVVDGDGKVIEPAWSEYQSDNPMTVYPALLPDRLDDYQMCDP